jgi:uncharacterized protein (TIGR00251 family)
MLDIRESEAEISFAVRVVPRASRNEITGVQGSALKVRLTAPPVEGKANRALIAFLAGVLGVKKGQVRIVAGQRARTKRIVVEGLTVGGAIERLLG